MARLRNFSFTLSDVSRRYVLRFEQRARSLSLTLPQCRALVRLEDHEGASQARLAEVAAMEPMTMVRTVDRLEERGLVERRPDPADRRARRLHLTAKGRRMLDEIWRLAELTRAEVLAGIGAREREVFFDVLERIHRNVCALKDPPDDGPATGAAAQRAARSAGKKARPRLKA
ncbi:MAG TPA: MarR family transcriptional regulator [Usitatibacter sp.]|nr:MarR family transcriptional regulator [Usitatibacter sp.]